MIRSFWKRAVASLAGTITLVACAAHAQAQASTAQVVTQTVQVQDYTAESANGSRISGSTPEGTVSDAARQSILRELEAMKQRIAELEANLKSIDASDTDAATALQGAKAKMDRDVGVEARTAGPAATNAISSVDSASTVVPAIDAEVTTKSAPFADSDWTWLNGNPRTKDTPMATRYFTPEFRADVNYILDFNHPKDDSMGGSTESFRSDEVQVEQLSFGGDIRVNNVHGRFLTMYGMFATTTPRNDASPSRGQWDLADAYRYVSEAWGGYHWNVQHGLNLDAGIFVSYIGLFSYYNFDNWAYQPSYVSSNTPWFFNGVRAQWFPTNKLKIEPWFINGWQSYGRPNGKPGLGGQILYRPKQWVSMTFNNYGLGEDAVGISDRSRLHTDDSVEVKYYDRPTKSLDKAAFTFTADAGCEFGGGVSCTGKGGNPKQSFLGYMLYNRLWFKKDLYAMTIGGGQMNNPGRYLVLLPPINGATASSGTPYYTENPGQKFHA